jgi:hypothetical protein
MVKKDFELNTEDILWTLASGVTAYLVYNWYKKSQATSNFSNASGRPWTTTVGTRTAGPYDYPIQAPTRTARPNQIKPIEAVITSQAELSRLISSAKSKGIQVPEQKLMQTFNTYKSALKSGTDIPPTIITAGKWKWKFGIWWRKPPGIKIRINI